MQKPDLRRPVTFDLAASLLDDLDTWIGAQELPPTKRAVIEAALREFLAKRWHLREKKRAK